MLRKFSFLCLVPMLAIAAAHAAVPETAESKQHLVYNVQHSRYGNIGTYTNTIERKGDVTDISSDGKLSVSLLGVSLYSQELLRHETWRGNRLVGFHGVTTENGKSVELNGKAEGDHFELNTPQGMLSAPADVRLANPWSKEAMDGEMMLTPDRGRLEMITVSNKMQTMVTIGGRQVKTEHYEVMRGSGPRRYEVWIDDKGVPVQFSLVGPENSITFTLAG